jgi:hypothetical protein
VNVVDGAPTLSDTQTYANSDFGVSFSYPTDWHAGEPNEGDYGFEQEIGSDAVYGPEVDLADRVYNQINSYNLMFKYAGKPGSLSLEEYLVEQPWLAEKLPLLRLADGETISNSRSVTTKVRDVVVGEFKGAEYVTTLAPGAQTDIFHIREVLLIDSEYNSVRVTE